MSSKEKILAAVKQNQPALQPLPFLQDVNAIVYENPYTQFCTVLKNIGGTTVEIKQLNDITEFVKYTFQDNNNYVTTIPGINEINMLDENLGAHFLENIEVAIIPALFAVAENGSVWVTEKEIKVRALPFICQHLCVVLSKKEIVDNMMNAYERIADNNYDFGLFIAGPSKTADIEQSLVLGAHGPKSMTIFMLD